MNGPGLVHELLLLSPVLLLLGCGADPVGTTPSLGIEPIAAVVNGVAQWDPNDDSTLYLHAIGIPDEELGRVLWTQSGLSLSDTVTSGPMLALHAGGNGCGYGGETFTITASLPGRNDAETIAVDMARYLCTGSPWLTPQDMTACYVVADSQRCPTSITCLRRCRFPVLPNCQHAGTGTRSEL